MLYPQKYAQDHSRPGRTENAKIEFAGLNVDPAIEPFHFLISGATGTGKQAVVEDLLRQLDRRGDRVVAIDPDGALMARFWREGDRVLNPLDADSVSWSPFAEMIDESEAPGLARLMIPEDPEDRYCALREILSAVLQKLHQSGRTTNGDLLGTLSGTRIGEVASMIPGSSIAETWNHWTPEKRATMQAAVLVSQRGWLNAMHPDAGERAWSIQRWAEDGSGWLWITGRAAQWAAMRPLMTTWIGTLAQTAVFCRMADRQRTWLILGDLADIRCPGVLSSALSNPTGVCAVATMRNLAHVHHVHGHFQSQALLSVFASHLILRAADNDMADWAVRTISAHPQAARNQVPDRRLLDPRHLIALPGQSGYLRLAGDPRVVPVDLSLSEKRANG